MELDILRGINIIISLVTLIPITILIFEVAARLFSGVSYNSHQMTGRALLGIFFLFGITATFNSLLLILILTGAVSAHTVDVLANVRVMVQNLLTLLVTWVFIQILRGKY